MTSLINFISGARPTRRGRAWRRGIAFLFPALALLLFRPARLRAADAGEILKGAKDAALKWKGYTCKYKTEAEQKGTKAETETGIVSYLAPSFLRIESTVHDPVSGETHKTIVTDGKFTYTEVRDPRNKIPFVTKTRNQIAEPDSIRIGQPLSPADTLDEMAKLFDLQSDDNATG
ncbi:hypothetical protein HY256_08450, partial [Candidatus Sumerlaeota bacterium]|nr:hypothetical protein [Candidatus Sumerlaeota bacterium]